MQNLIDFLYRFRTFGLFIVLEVICAWLIVGYNQYYNASFLNSSNALVGNITRLSTNTSRFIDLKKINQSLMEENSLLRQQLANTNLQKIKLDTFESRYEVVVASVLNHTFLKPANYITLDAGKADGLFPGMGVISDRGIVGQIKSVSRNFATVTSLLHPKSLVSITVKNSNTLGTVQWGFNSYFEADLKYIPRHTALNVGDSIVTSGYNAVFPPNILVGIVKQVSLDIQNPFYDAQLDLSTDFSSLGFVYIIDNTAKAEIDSLTEGSDF